MFIIVTVSLNVAGIIGYKLEPIQESVLVKDIVALSASNSVASHTRQVGIWHIIYNALKLCREIVEVKVVIAEQVVSIIRSRIRA